VCQHLDLLLLDVTLHCECRRNVRCGSLIDLVFDLPALRQFLIIILNRSQSFKLSINVWPRWWIIRHRWNIHQLVDWVGCGRLDACPLLFYALELLLIHLYCVFFLFQRPSFNLTLISAGALSTRISWRVKVFRFPICPYKASWFLKISREVEMLLFPLNFCFKTTARLRPLVHRFFGFLVAALFLKLFVLMLKPSTFHALLSQRIRRHIMEIIWLSFKSVLLGIFNWDRWIISIDIWRVKCVEWLSFNSTLSLVELLI